MMKPDKCPKCGASYVRLNLHGGITASCGSSTNRKGDWMFSARCKDRQIAQLERQRCKWFGGESG